MQNRKGEKYPDAHYMVRNKFCLTRSERRLVSCFVADKNTKGGARNFIAIENTSKEENGRNFTPRREFWSFYTISNKEACIR